MAPRLTLLASHGQPTGRSQPPSAGVGNNLILGYGFPFKKTVTSAKFRRPFRVCGELSMTAAIICIFVVGYLLIALEHPIHINKAATAMLTGVLCWTLAALYVDDLVPAEVVPEWFQMSITEGSTADGVDPSEVAAAAAVTAATDPTSDEPGPPESPVQDVTAPHAASAGTAAHADEHEHLNREYLVEGELGHHLYEIASILFFLMGAMTIVELVDANEGFSIITRRINATSKVTLLWLIAWITFFLSALLDNLTTTIVMVSLLRKLIADHNTRLLYAGLIIVAANAGGAWSVIGDVTTTMLWVKHKITTLAVARELFLPSIACLLIPLLVLSRTLTGPLVLQAQDGVDDEFSKELPAWHPWLFLILGICGLLCVPVFKAVTHLPPFMGMIGVLSILWIVSEVTAHRMDERTRSSTGVLHVLQRIDMSSILFFLGILLAVGALGSIGLLGRLAVWLDTTIPYPAAVATVIGLLSAIVDNVPLVAAGIEMYGNKPTDGFFWMMLAYCAGTGGSCLVIGSAAGVAAMGLEKLEFVWYLRKIGPWALLGYFSGVAVYLLQHWSFRALGWTID